MDLATYQRLQNSVTNPSSVRLKRRQPMERQQLKQAQQQ